MSKDDPFGSEGPHDDKIRWPAPGGWPSSDETIIRPKPGAHAPSGPFGDETIIRPKPGAHPPSGPFGDETILRPKANEQPWPEHRAEQAETGWGSGQAQSMAAPESVLAKDEEALPSQFPGQAVFDENPFISPARSLLALVSSLRSTPMHDAVAELQQRLTQEIREFESRLLKEGIAEEQARLASYALCALLDEAVLNTPWGANSFWGHQTLLVIFHQEAFGGEKFFQILEHLTRRPAQNLELIELFWICLALGFEGKYRLLPNGANQLEQARSDIYQLIHRIRGDQDAELSVRWRGIQDARNPLTRYAPLWVVASVAGALLLVIYLGFVLWLNGVSDAVARDLYALGREEPALAALPHLPSPPPPPGPSAKEERFKRILKDEIARGLVEVVDERTLRIRNSFPSGSDRVKPDYLPLLGKVAKELERGNDSVLVIGHTDNTPIVSARFPSNFELSTARGGNVAQALEAAANIGGKVKFEGRADYEPLVPNDSPENKAVNRRVDILIR